jgi:arginine dihydrolase
MRVLMCRPEYFLISYEINPWMNIQHGVNSALAKQQWETLYRTILDCGASVDLVPPVAGLPDLVFTANCAAYFGSDIYLSRFKYPERQPEREIFKRWFTQNGYSIAEEPTHFFDRNNVYIGPAFEGAGDALFLGDILFTAYGFRTDREIYPALCRQFSVQKSVLCELVDPYFYHLDTCFCPLNDRQAIWFPPAFAAESQRRMEQAAELFAIPTEEARYFACNTVILGKHAVIPDQCPATQAILEKLGFTVHRCPMTEFIKSGGACKCLTFLLPT